MTNTQNSNENNQYLKHYGEHNISPVHQDISNFAIHLARRERLYITLGIPAVCFEGKRLLEIGPGGGYNALAYFHWKANVDFVEPNKTARKELKQLCKKHKTSDYRLFKEKFEDFKTDEKYDIIIAEGFIPLLSNRLEILNQIFSYLKPGGICAITCVDDTSFFFEYLRKIIALKLFHCLKVDDFNEKVKLLTAAYGSHYKTLKYASRPVEDWIIDNLLNPYSFGDLFSIGECIDAIAEGYEFMNSSPDLFTNYQWYKDYEYDHSADLKKQFAQKRHNLIMAGLDETVRPAPKNEELNNSIRAVRNVIEKNTAIHDDSFTAKIIEQLEKIIENISDIDARAANAVKEAIVLISDKKINCEKISGSRYLSSAFGRGQQYVSIVKKLTNIF